MARSRRSRPAEACRSLNVELWFDESKFSERRAKAICATCPERERCRQLGLDTTAELIRAGRSHEDEGIFGGLTALERASLVNQRHSTVEQTDRKDPDG